MGLAKMVVLAALLGGMIGGLVAQGIVIAVKWVFNR